jgi:hypothetical protein
MLATGRDLSRLLIGQITEDLIFEGPGGSLSQLRRVKHGVLLQKELYSFRVLCPAG